MRQVLLVEDSLEQARLVQRWLHKCEGLKVTVASSGAQACELIGERAFDLMVVDIQLPDMSGMHIVRYARSAQPRCRIVFVTAHSSIEHAQGALRLGADDFVEKPLERGAFVARVKHWLQGASGGAPAPVVLAIGAHPDDVEIGCGGTLLRHAALGHRVTMLVMSSGEAGGPEGLRREEAAIAARRLGARLVLETLPDRRVPDAGESVDAISRVIDGLRPSVVYTHSAHDNHQDHRAVHRATLIAARRVPTLCCYQSPSTTTGFRPVYFSRIDAELPGKLDLIGCYTSQTQRCRYLESELIVATARYWGRFTGEGWVEPFEVVRAEAGLFGALEGHRSVAASPGH